jgi:hypothetical protein
MGTGSADGLGRHGDIAFGAFNRTAKRFSSGMKFQLKHLF